MGFFDKLKAGLSKTKNGLMSGINSLFRRGNLDDDFYDELEELLILSDLGGKTSEEIVESLRERVKENKIKDPMEARQALKDIITEMLGEDVPLNLSTKPSVILVIGVNGAGKTTTIGKLSYQLKNDGKKVLVAAADTFRAAAVDQLQVWCDRAGVDIIKHAEGSDPAAVVFDAMDAAKARNVDVVIVDTAGRLQTKKNLMAELSKISRIVHSKAEDCALEVLIALDATTGQNAVNQAREFNEAADITGIILTKLDSTAKGGIVIPIVNELKVPVKIVTVGEKIDDIQPFVAKDFVDALFDEGGDSQ
ncbi:MAG: signal recognition particle-docking protein FtsY [Oscillospiraceae bacterium]|nr:signal recognition particle-docking protein FtsY [Oscillospiraceae bacterium]